MLDMPLAQAGAIVSLALSNDEDHPGSNVIDGYILNKCSLINSEKVFKF